MSYIGKIQFILLLFIYAIPARSLTIDEVHPRFNLTSDFTIEDVNKLRRNYQSEESLKEYIFYVFYQNKIRKPWFDIVQDNDRNILTLYGELPSRIEKVSTTWKGSKRFRPDFDHLKFKRGDIVSETSRLENEIITRDFLRAQGFPLAECQLKREDNNLTYEVDLKDPLMQKKHNIEAQSEWIKSYIENNLKQFYNTPVILKNIRTSLDLNSQELFDDGYYLNSIQMNSNMSEHRVDLEVRVSGEELFIFQIEGVSEREERELKSFVRNQFRQRKKVPTKYEIITQFESYFKKKAYLNTSVNVNIKEYKSKREDKIKHYEILVDKKRRTRVSSIRFSGNKAFSDQALQDLFELKAFDLAKEGFFDEDYYKYFKKQVREAYYKKGYVLFEIQDPSIEKGESPYDVILEFHMKEDFPTRIGNVFWKNIPSDLQVELEELTGFKSGEFFNPLSFRSDLNEAIELLNDKGYLDAKVENFNETNIVQYDERIEKVSLDLNFSLGRQYKFHNYLIIGNDKTRDKLIARRIQLEKGELITRRKLKGIQDRLISLGLFSSVSIRPMKTESSEGFTDLLIAVKEADFGSLEIAPGFRSDLGVKVSSQLSYNNLSGMRRSIDLESRVNRRISNSSLRANRPEIEEFPLEYLINMKYSELDLFDTQFSYQFDVSQQFRRFYGFDANIFGVSNTFSKDLTRRLSANFSYQLERVSQKNAALIDDNGRFRIGSIIPGISLDFRNSRINPLQGSFFALSSEYANELFGSQSGIHFYKLLSQNRFYIPHSRGTIAMNFTLGYQKNLSSRERIPSLKVFRLSGSEIVRGYSDEEMNYLSKEQEDISLLRVDNNAFLFNFKFEPRFFLTESTMLGVFFDAGKVSLDTERPFSMNSSVGISFKYVTPVGTLDFDYGFKLHRRNINGSQEDPGRLHVSIGFF